MPKKYDDEAIEKHMEWLENEDVEENAIHASRQCWKPRSLEDLEVLPQDDDEDRTE